MVRELPGSQLANNYEFCHIASQADELSQFGKILLAIVSFIHYAWFISTRRPELVYIHVGGNASLYRKIPFIAFGRLSGRRVLAHFHAGDFVPYFNRQSGAGRRLILWGLNQSHRLLTCSHELKRLLEHHLPEAQVDVLPNGVETKLFATKRRLRTEAQKHDPVRLLFAGAMGRLKGERDLVQAIERASRKLPNLRVLMLGHGSETVMELCKETGLWPQLEYFGPAPMNERVDFFKQCDLFVLPTYAEGMPVSVIEAMAAGLPVITTPVGGIPELITDGVEGWLVTPGDVDALAEKIALLVNNEPMRLAMGRLAVLKAAQFDRHEVFALLDQVLSEMIGITWVSEARPVAPVIQVAPEQVVKGQLVRAKTAGKE